jgi:hypothetical protein
MPRMFRNSVRLLGALTMSLKGLTQQKAPSGPGIPTVQESGAATPSGSMAKFAFSEKGWPAACTPSTQYFPLPEALPAPPVRSRSRPEEAWTGPSGRISAYGWWKLTTSGRRCRMAAITRSTTFASRQGFLFTSGTRNKATQ